MTNTGRVGLKNMRPNNKGDVSAGPFTQSGLSSQTGLSRVSPFDTSDSSVDNLDILFVLQIKVVHFLPNVNYQATLEFCWIRIPFGINLFNI